MRLILLLALSLLLAGCASSKITPSALSEIVPGQTTRGEIEKHFGRPRRTTSGSSQKTVADYLEQLELLPSGSQEYMITLRSLSVLYDRNGVVEKFVHHESSKPVVRTVHGKAVGSPVPRANWIKKGETTANDVITLCGPPDFKTLTPGGDLLLGWNYAQQTRGNYTSYGVETFLVLVDENRIVRDYEIRDATLPQMRP